MEGLLKVLAERDSEEARTALSEKFEQFSSLMRSVLESDTVKNSDPVKEDVEIKDEEATEAEDDDSGDDLAASIVAKETAEVPNTVAAAFSDNAKDFFVRTVFDGNEKDFEDTVTLLSHMNSFSEAQDYLYNDMMLDSNNSNVEKFMDVVSKNMPH